MTDQQQTPENILRDWTNRIERQHQATKDAIAERIDRLDWTVLPDYWQAQYKYLIAAEIDATLDHTFPPDAASVLDEIETDLQARLLKGFLQERSTSAVSRAQGDSNEDAARELLHTDFPCLRARIERAVSQAPTGRPVNETSGPWHPITPTPASL